MKVGGPAVRSTLSMVATADPLIGTEVRRFKLVRLVGRGGMGRVYEGVHDEIGSRVAIKVIAEQYAQDAEHAERFFAEARAVNLIRHDGIVNIFDLDRLPDGRPVIVMEFVEGETLRQRMQAGPVPLGGLVSAIDQVLAALHAAHAIGVVHRDLKPDNIMITPSGRAKVLDFGIAKLLVPDGQRVAPRTRTGVVLGTPEYMAPEQIDEGIADARTDVYALGIVLFEVITGRRPFDGPSDYAIMRAQVETPAPSVRTMRADVPVELEQVIARALAKRPRDRFGSAKAMADALMFAAQALPPEQWRALSPNGMAIRRPVEAPPTEPAAGESLPTARLAIAEMPTAKQTPGARDAALHALRSSHHTADAVRPEPAAIDRLNAATRPSKPPPPAVQAAAPRPAPRRAVLLASLGVAAAATAAIVAYQQSTPRERRTQVAVTPVTASDASSSPPLIDTPTAIVEEPDSDDVTGQSPATPQLDFVGKADAGIKLAKQTKRDAGVPVAKPPPTRAADTEESAKRVERDEAASTGPAPVAKPDRFRPPIPDKYKTIPGIQIDPDTNVLTVYRIRLEQPFTDLDKIDVARYAATAKQLARKLESDAELTAIDAPVDRDGKPTRGPLYYFASRQARESKDAGRLACISVGVQPWDKPVVAVTAGGTTGCAEFQPTRLPKCSVADVTKHFPGNDDWYWIHYTAIGWRIGHNSNGAIIAKFPDDC